MVVPDCPFNLLSCDLMFKIKYVVILTICCEGLHVTSPGMLMLQHVLPDNDAPEFGTSEQVPADFLTQIPSSVQASHKDEVWFTP